MVQLLPNKAIIAIVDLSCSNIDLYLSYMDSAL